MTTTKDDALSTDDRLLELHVQIARRADQLARRRHGTHTREVDMQCWLEAERQVLDHADCALEAQIA